MAHIPTAIFIHIHARKKSIFLPICFTTALTLSHPQIQWRSSLLVVPRDKIFIPDRNHPYFVFLWLSELGKGYREDRTLQRQLAAENYCFISGL